MAATVAIGEQIRAPIRQEMDALEQELDRAFASEIGLVSAIGRHLATMKGKRLRPAMALLAAKIGACETSVAVKVATAVEIVHTATLLHDDSIDRSHLRRGLPTVNRLWNDQVSVIMGDHLFCKAFRILHEAGLFDVASVLSAGSDSMTYGEMFQMDLRGKYDISEDTYLAMVKHKTASLFASACEAGAIVGGLSAEERSDLKAYGENLGIAFQIIDDILDFIGDVTLMGKPVGNDLRDGRVTLPLIVALRNGGSADEIRRAEWADVVRLVEDSGGVEYSRRLAESFAALAKEHLAGLRSCPAANSLRLVADHVVLRKK